MWEFPVLSVQFVCKPKIILKIKEISFKDTK